MAWPIPRDLIVAAPRLTWPYANKEERKANEAKVAEYLQSFTPEQSRVVLMAKKDDHIRVHPDLKWKKEPWYGTEYGIQRFDSELIAEVCYSRLRPMFHEADLFCRQTAPMTFLSYFCLDRTNSFPQTSMLTRKKLYKSVSFLSFSHFCNG